MNAEMILRGSVDRPAIVAHRGLWRGHAENSLAAIDAAVAAGADIVEIGIRRTRDGAFVAIDDATLDRTTNLQGPVCDSSLERLSAARLRAGAGGAAAAIGTARLPSLEDVLGAARGRVLLHLDVKDRADLISLSRVVGQMGMRRSTIVKAGIATAEEAALWVDAIAGNAIFMPVLSTCRSPWLPVLVNDIRYLRLPCIEVACDCIEELQDVAVLARAQRAGIMVSTLAASHIPGLDDSQALLDPAAVWGRLALAGASAIRTDEVEAIARFRQERRAAA